MKILAALAAVAVAGLASALISPQAATAHRNACHTKHACPSDHHTYRWGPKKLSCAAKTAREYRAARDKIRVTYAGRVYYCHR